MLKIVEYKSMQMLSTPQPWGLTQGPRPQLWDWNPDPEPSSLVWDPGLPDLSPLGLYAVSWSSPATPCFKEMGQPGGADSGSCLLRQLAAQTLLESSLAQGSPDAQPPLPPSMMLAIWAEAACGRVNWSPTHVYSAVPHCQQNKKTLILLEGALPC